MERPPCGSRCGRPLPGAWPTPQINNLLRRGSTQGSKNEGVKEGCPHSPSLPVMDQGARPQPVQSLSSRRHGRSPPRLLPTTAPRRPQPPGAGRPAGQSGTNPTSRVTSPRGGDQARVEAAGKCPRKRARPTSWTFLPRRDVPCEASREQCEGRGEGAGAPHAHFQTEALTRHEWKHAQSITGRASPATALTRGAARCTVRGLPGRPTATE